MEIEIEIEKEKAKREEREQRGRTVLKNQKPRHLEEAEGMKE